MGIWDKFKKKDNECPSVLKISMIYDRENIEPISIDNMKSNSIICSDIDSLRNMLEMNNHSDVIIYKTRDKNNSMNYIVEFIDGYCYIGRNKIVYKNLLDNIFKTSDLLVIDYKLNYQETDNTYLHIMDNNYLVVSSITQVFPLADDITNYRSYDVIPDEDPDKYLYPLMSKFNSFCIKYNLK